MCDDASKPTVAFSEAILAYTPVEETRKIIMEKEQVGKTLSSTKVNW